MLLWLLLWDILLFSLLLGPSSYCWGFIYSFLLVSHLIVYGVPYCFVSFYDASIALSLGSTFIGKRFLLMTGHRCPNTLMPLLCFGVPCTSRYSPNGFLFLVKSASSDLLGRVLQCFTRKCYVPCLVFYHVILGVLPCKLCFTMMT